MRGFYEAEPAAFCDTISPMLGMRHVTVERWEAVNGAVGLHRRGLYVADALYWASSASYSQFANLDDRRVVRRARRLELAPAVVLAK